MKRTDWTSGLPAGLLIPLLVAGLATAAPRQQVDETLDANPEVELSIELITGDIEVVGWDRNAVQITGRLGADVEALDITGGGDRISIEPRLSRGDHREHRDLDVDLEIRMPFRGRLDLESVTAPVRVRELEGRISVESVSGDIDIQGTPDEVEVSVVSGSVSALVGEVRRARFEAVSGAVRFEGGVSRSGHLDAETVSGLIELVLPADIAADFDVESFSGSIDNELGPEARRSSRWVPSRELRFSNGGGGARISLETLSGRIRIRAR